MTTFDAFNNKGARMRAHSSHKPTIGQGEIRPMKKSIFFAVRKLRRLAFSFDL
jgi:hypothetical protein